MFVPVAAGACADALVPPEICVCWDQFWWTNSDEKFNFPFRFAACAPQPTEDSSSSPAEGPNEPNNCPENSILSDSDDRQNFTLALKAKQSCLFGNFESDSLNENFSPTR